MQADKITPLSASALFQVADSVSTDAMAVMASSGRILHANGKICEHFEYSRDELLELTFSDLAPECTAKMWTQLLEDLRSHGKKKFETQGLTKSRQSIAVEVTATYVDFDAQDYCCVLIRDVTQSKRSAQLARLQHDILAKVASATGELHETLNELCRLVEEMVPQSLTSIMVVDPNDGCLRFEAGQITPELRSIFEPLQPGEAAGSCGAAAYFKTPIIVEDTRVSQYWKSLQDVVKEYNLLACWSLPILDEREQVLGTFAISHQRKAKPTEFQCQVLETASHLASIAMRRQRFEEQLRFAHEEMAHISRLNTMGQMASSFAHELNQPLAAIVNYAFVLEKSAEREMDLDVLPVHAKSIREQAMRAGEIVTSVRNMAKRTTTERKQVSLNELVDRALAMLGPELRHMGVSLRRNLNDALPDIEVDEIQIQQVLINLVRNAIDAMQDTARVGRALTIVTDLDESQKVVLRVADAGPGLPEEEFEAVFEPFRTSKPDGMGMGLTICRSIAESHSGQLVAVGGNGGGATFQLTLPLDSGASA